LPRNIFMGLLNHSQLLPTCHYPPNGSLQALGHCLVCFRVLWFPVLPPHSIDPAPSQPQFVSSHAHMLRNLSPATHFPVQHRPRPTVKIGFKRSSRTRKGNGGRAVGSARSLGLLQKEIKEDELADSGANGSPKWRRPVGHDIRAKEDTGPFPVYN
jgi:hypothetical protein